MKKLIQFFLIGLSYSIIIYSQNEKSPEEIYRQSYKSIVLISSFDKNEALLKTGSGIIISQDGLIYTNFHVISGAETIKIKRDSSDAVIAKVAGFNPLYDAAILKIDGDAFRTIKICDNNEINIGEKVYALGNPLGLTNTFSSGIISARREYNEMNSIQYTASTSHGSSGGALLNSNGELIGITSAGYDDGQNLNIAIPVSYFKEVSLIDYGDSDKISLTQTIMKSYSDKFANTHKNDSLIYNFAYCMSPCKYSYMMVSDLYSKAGLNDSAAIFLTMSIAIDSTDKLLYKMRGDAYSAYHKVDSAITDYTKAIADYEKILKKKPEYMSLYLWMAEDYLNLKDTLNAKNCLDKSFFTDTEGGLYERRARLYRELNNSEGEIGDLTFALLCYDNSDRRFTRAIAYTKDEKFKLAENDYLEVIKKEPINADAYNNLAYCYLAENDFENAEKYFKQSLKCQPLHTDSYLGLAILSFRQSKIKNAKGFMYSAMKTKRELEYGNAGLKKMEDSGYYWKSDEKKDMIKIFRLMGITKTIEEAGKNKIFKHNFKHHGARKA